MYQNFIGEAFGAEIITGSWGFFTYEHRNNFLCVSGIFIEFHYRGLGTLDKIVEISEGLARERKLEYVGFKLEARTHGFEKLCEIAENYDFERVTVQPEYILYLRKV